MTFLSEIRILPQFFLLLMFGTFYSNIFVWKVRGKHLKQVMSTKLEIICFSGLRFYKNQGVLFLFPSSHVLFLYRSFVEIIKGIFLEEIVLATLVTELKKLRGLVLDSNIIDSNMHSDGK